MWELAGIACIAAAAVLSLGLVVYAVLADHGKPPDD